MNKSMTNNLPPCCRPGAKATKKDYLNLVWAGLILAVLYLIYRALGGGDFNLNTSADLTWPLILGLGLTAGFSSCLALIGGLILGFSTYYEELNVPGGNKNRFLPHVFFNLGRIVGFFLLGGFLGVLGSFIKLSGLTISVLTAVVALVMLFLGLKIINIFPIFNKLALRLPQVFSKLFNRPGDGYSYGKISLLGALTFFLPCGFTQAMQVLAIGYGNFLVSGLVMAVFALGTAPGLLSLGGVVAIKKKKGQALFYKVVGLALIVFAVFNLVNAYNLSGLEGRLSSGLSSTDTYNTDDPAVKVVNGVQIVTMEENNRGYSPSSFIIKKSLPVRWVITAKNPFSCAGSIVIPDLNIQKNLEAGENIIEFTPPKIGVMTFSCSMGMYRGRFNIVE